MAGGSTVGYSTVVGGAYMAYCALCAPHSSVAYIAKTAIYAPPAKRIAVLEAGLVVQPCGSSSGVSRKGTTSVVP